jgi:hypothetical protein
MKRLTGARVRRWAKTIDAARMSIAAVEREVLDYKLEAKGGRCAALGDARKALRGVHDPLVEAEQRITEVARREGWVRHDNQEADDNE